MDLLLLLLLVDLADLALLMLLRVDWRSSRFLLIVRCRFLLLADAAFVVNHGCCKITTQYAYKIDIQTQQVTVSVS